MYGTAVDIWAAGCVLAELLGRRPLFAGKTYQDVVAMQVALLGTRPAVELEYIRSAEALTFLAALPPAAKTPWREVFAPAHVSSKCAALLDALLAWHPGTRATAQEALRMPYFDSVRAQYSELEPVPPEVDLQSFETADPPLAASELRALVVAEAAALAGAGAGGTPAAAPATATATATVTAAPPTTAAAPPAAVLTAAPRRG